MYNSCCKDCTDDTNPQCPNYNPCKNFEEPTGRILNPIGFSSNWSDSFGMFDIGDTLLGKNGLCAIYCIAEDTNCEYEWKIGSETLTTRSIKRYDVPLYTPIEVTLKVTKKDPNNCIPIDRRIKYSKRIFYGIEEVEGMTYRYYGKWKGYYTDEPNKEVVVEFKTAKNKIYSPAFDRIPVLPYCRTNIYCDGEFKDTLTNVPYVDDAIYWDRNASSNYSARVNFYGQERQLNLAFILNSIYTKKTCEYNPYYQPSVYISMPNINKINIEVWAMEGWNTTNVLWRRTFVGSRIN
jgi:hypothetical protein